MEKSIPNIIDTKTIEFVQELIIPFSYLNNNLEDKIYNTLVEHNFSDKDFEVLEILDFTILEMMVKGEKNIECKIKIKGKCNNPEIDELLIIDSSNKYKILNDNVLYFDNSKIQILVKLENKKIKTPFVIKIKTKKKITSNIICTATIVL